ncbi:MAG: PQQ-binding-like beta-propeller repeat protein [Proteobacteria bacterium]|nr:PQQ-binding-like beta-propeller repeat protein [Pseudomonadota bacterium]
MVSVLLAAILLTCSGLAVAQDIPLFNTEPDEWYTLGGDYAHTRFTPADEITADNFADLEVVWEWDGASFNSISSNGRSTPSLIDGKLITVAGDKRYVIAIDPKTGETLWTYREPDTGRSKNSMRSEYGKGVGFGEVDGRGVIYIISPAFFLTALDVQTGVPLEGFGRPVPINGFPKTGVVDLLADLGHPYDPYDGIPLEIGYITSSSPPIVVNDTVIVGNSAEHGYHQKRIENVPGDILAYDARTGAFKWRFNVIPKPGEYGHETWENDAWQWTGDVSSWAPLSADPVNNLVYIPTNSATLDYYGGFRPGDNLYGASLIALDVETGERAWHFQMVKHEIWNYDNPTAPVLLDLNMPGRGVVPAVMQVSKQAWVYAFNRVTGEPLWPIVDRPVPPSIVPGEVLSPTQPHVTKPAAFDMQGITEDDLIDFTPALRAEALEVMEDYVMGPLFTPPIHADNPMGKYAAMNCPGGGGGANIDAPPVADPATGMLYVSSTTRCFTLRLVAGEESELLFPSLTGTTIARYANGALRGPQARPPRLASGLPIWKPPYSRITAIDMNSGEHVWMIPTGETPDRIKNNPALEGVDIGNTGAGVLVPMLATKTMLIYSGQASDGTPILYAIDKTTGDTIGEIEAPARSFYGISSWVYDGHQYLILQTGGKLTAMALPAARGEGGKAH